MAEQSGKGKGPSSRPVAVDGTAIGAAASVSAKGGSPRRRAGLRHTTPALPEPCSEPFKILASLISVAERFKTDLGNLRPDYPQMAEVIHFLDITQLSAEQLLPVFECPPDPGQALSGSAKG